MLVAFDFPLVLPSMSNERMHHRVRSKLVKKQRATTELFMRCNAVGSRLPVVTPGHKLVVHMTRIAPRAIRDEHDNLRTAFKHVVDAIAAYFHIDDSDKRIEWRYAQAHAKQSGVRVEFEVVAALMVGVVPTRRARAPRRNPEAETLQQRLNRLARPATYQTEDPEGT